MNTMKRWIRRRVRAWLGVEAEIAELRGRVYRLENAQPKVEKRVKVHHAE